MLYKEQFENEADFPTYDSLQLRKAITDELNLLKLAIHNVRVHFRKQYKTETELDKFLQEHFVYQRFTAWYDRFNLLRNFNYATTPGERATNAWLVAKDKELYEYFFNIYTRPKGVALTVRDLMYDAVLHPDTIDTIFS